jgi:beta-galactosidase GanA
MHTQPVLMTTFNRSLMLNGARALFLSGAAHYPRATPAMWPAVAANAKKLGLNMIEACAASTRMQSLRRCNNKLR